MREMKNSGIEWIGEIPANWNIIKIKYLVKEKEDIFIDGDWIESPYIIDNGIRYLTTGNIGDGKYKEQGNGYISSETFSILNCKYAYPGDLVFSRLNAPYGRSCILPNYEKKYVLAVDNVILRTNMNNSFISYITQCNGYQKIAEDKSAGTTMKRISRTNLGNIQIPLPSLLEQNRIANYLDKKCSEIDTLYSDIQEEIKVLEEYKKSVITEAVTKGLDKDVEMKDSGIEWIGEIPEHWEIRKTKYICDSLSKGNGITKENVLIDGNIACVRYGEIYTKYNNKFSKCYSYTNVEQILSPKYISKGDILFAGTGELIEEIGKNIVYLGDSPCLAGGDIVIMKHSQNPIFFNYAMNSDYSRIQKSKGKAKLKVVHISATEIGNILIILPPLEEQDMIAKYLDDKCNEIDKAIEEKNKQLELLSEYKKSIIYEYVTGKKEVPANDIK